jgi:hypothetical protein
MSEKDHDVWLKKFNKSKAGHIYNLLWEVKEYKANLRGFNKLNHLSAALFTLTKGTKYEKDVTELIIEIDPEFFEEKNQLNNKQ